MKVRRVLDDSGSVFHGSQPEQLLKNLSHSALDAEINPAFSKVCNALSFLSVPLAEKQVTSAQIKEHRVVVLDLSETYLKSEFIHLF